MPKKILIVDDDPVVVRLVESILTDRNYEVSSAIDGLDALVKIKNQNPDLVILDIVMPEINGYDVAFELRFNRDFEQIPIVILTETEKELDDKIAERVNIAYLPKPVDPKPLIAKIEDFLKGNK